MAQLAGKITCFPDSNGWPEWRVEYADEDGGAYVAVFAGPKAELRARAYLAALEIGVLQPVPASPNDEAAK